MDLSAQTHGSPIPPLDVILERMGQARLANHARFLPYKVTRDYTFFGKNGQDIRSQVTADLTFVPPDQKEFTIREASGIRMGTKIVRRVLASEAEIAKDDSAEISARNYTFRLLGEETVDAQQSYVLELHPRRADAHLMVGKVWVDSHTYLLRRAEGEPAQRSSWWVRSLHFALLFGNVEGMWLATSFDATADLRFIGQFRMVSHDTGYSIDKVAEVTSPDLSQNSNDQPMPRAKLPKASSRRSTP